MKKHLLLVFNLFLLILLLSCQKTTTTKYVLTEMSTFNQNINIDDTYNYYYIEFNSNNEFILYYNKKIDNIDVIEYGSYTKTENMYVVNANGMTINYMIDENKLECNITVAKFIFELEE